jgi:uncharacterized protein YggU (UPF0235/DUF167 family)
MITKPQFHCDRKWLLRLKTHPSSSLNQLGCNYQTKLCVVVPIKSHPVDFKLVR